MITPPLTTIKQPDYEMGKLACAVLMEQLNAETGQSENRGVRLEPRLIVRESVRRVQVL
jgi:LacI family transcriptional regulator